MKFRPLICHVDSVVGILENRKRQTRRVLLPQPDSSTIGGQTMIRFPGRTLGFIAPELWRGFTESPYGDKGDGLWVREPIRSDNGKVQFVADSLTIDVPFPEGKRPHRLARWMPRNVCRLELEIVDVRIEQLQQITDDDARDEGVRPAPYRENKIWIANPENARRHVTSFRRLWDGLNAERGFGWSTNPWVWVVTFKRYGALMRKEQT